MLHCPSQRQGHPLSPHPLFLSTKRCICKEFSALLVIGKLNSKPHAPLTRGINCVAASQVLVQSLKRMIPICIETGSCLWCVKWKKNRLKCKSVLWLSWDHYFCIKLKVFMEKSVRRQQFSFLCDGIKVFVFSLYTFLYSLNFYNQRKIKEKSETWSVRKWLKVLGNEHLVSTGLSSLYTSLLSWVKSRAESSQKTSFCPFFFRAKCWSSRPCSGMLLGPTNVRKCNNFKFWQLLGLSVHL